jgi:hypothetical protein
MKDNVENVRSSPADPNICIDVISAFHGYAPSLNMISVEVVYAN